MAFTALMELASATNISNNILHRDVIDAMMRQPNSAATKPFAANIITDHTILPAVDYDLGINGAAYYDMDTANYRLSNPKMTVGNLDVHIAMTGWILLLKRIVRIVIISLILKQGSGCNTPSM